MAHDLVISARRTVPAAALSIKTARSQGPGGQHVNRTETKVQMLFDPRRVDWIDEGLRLRIVALAGRNVDGEGRVLLVSQEHREQARNLEAVRDKLKELIERASTRPRRRIATKPSRAAKARRVNEKKQRAQTNAGRARVSRDD
jgi:ribosome-associated protein